MKVLKVFVAVMALFMLAGPAKAETKALLHSGSFASHVDFLQGYSTGSTSGLLVVGYHFTGVKWGRLRTLGLGFAYAGRSAPNPKKGRSYEDEWQGEFMVTSPVADIRLTRVPAGDGWEGCPDIYLSVRYEYSVTNRAHGGVIGFSFGW